MVEQKAFGTNKKEWHTSPGKMPSRDVGIIVPLYKEEPSEEELFAIGSNLNVLNRFQTILIAPTGFNSEKYGKINKYFNKKIYLKPRWFKSLNSYNRLLLNKSFYKMFLEYEYILLMQPDTLIFNTDLKYWCDLEYSYIGAPWPNGTMISSLAFPGHRTLRKLFPSFDSPKRFIVGNGGLSLRNVNDCLTMLKRHPIIAGTWYSQEDFFFAYYFMIHGNEFSMPAESVASLFSLEQNAEQYFFDNCKRMPFGCHAYIKYNFDYGAMISIEAKEMNK